jgi:Zn-dependent metalloprotease
MKKYLTLIACLAMTSLCYAQNFEEHSLSANGSVRHAELAKAAPVYKLAAPDLIFSKLLKTNADDKFVLYNQETDVLGITHHHYQQYYKGVQVAGGYYWLHGLGQNLTHLNGDYQKISNLEVKPTLQEAQALEKVLSSLQAQEYAWQNKAQEAFIKMVKEDKNASYYPKGELQISKNHELAEKIGKEQYHLCYVFNITATKPDLHLRVYVDAHTGEIIHKVSTVCSIGGTAHTRYNGVVGIETERVANGGFRLYDSLRNVHTRNFVGGADFIDNDNNWTQMEHNPVVDPTNNDVALDAHWGAAQTLTYFENAHQHIGWDGNGSRLNQFVHALPSGTSDNAQWEGASNVALYGDGGTIFKPLTDLDIVAHEIGHGVSQAMQLGYDGGETGAINEAYSDIWAACVQENWQIGEKVMKNGKAYLRNLTDPKNTNAENTGCTTYLRENWNNGRYAKGMVFSHWFYLLSVGGTGRNDNNNNYAVVGISQEKAARIAYRMYAYLGMTPKMLDVVWASRMASRELYGECSQEVISVDNALYAVGLRNQPYQEPFLVFNNPPTEICNGQQKYVYGNYGEENVIYEWHTTGNGLRIVGDSMNMPLRSIKIAYVPIPFAPATAQPRGYRGISLTAHCRTGKDAAGNWVYGNRRTITRDIWVGKPDEVGELQTYYPYLCGTYGNHADIAPVAGATSYRWFSASSALSIRDSKTNSAILTVDIRQRVREVGFIVVAGNDCTVFPQSITDLEFKAPDYTWRYFTIEVVDDMSCFRVMPPDEIKPENVAFSGYPNPASSSYTIGSEQKTAFSYKVFNSVGSLLTEGNSENGENAVLQVSAWADGIYTVLIQTESGVQALKLAVQKGNVAN